MRLAPLLMLGSFWLSGAAAGQTTRSVLLPPNAIDRATASTDARAADARRAADADRLNASIAERDAGSAASGQVQQSTMTDTADGFGTSQEIGAPVTPAPPPPRT